jgi:hypothetical protein
MRARGNGKGLVQSSSAALADLSDQKAKWLGDLTPQAM